MSVSTTRSTAGSSKRPSHRFTKIVSLAVVPVALLFSGLVVGKASYSAYSATTVNPTSNWASGTVELSDDDKNTAAFSASNLAPGARGTQCIVVTSSGSLASTVKLYATDPTSTNDLASYIDLTITQGRGGSFGSCEGFRAAEGGEVFSNTLEFFGAKHTDFASGVGSWDPTGEGSESVTYQIDYRFSGDAPNSTQGGTASVGLTWEAQNS